jgi:hypothetical protein
MRTEIYDKKLQNIIESEFRNNNIDNKGRIKKFIQETKENTEIKVNSESLINAIESNNKEYVNEYEKTITNEDLNKALGDPTILLGLNKQELINEFIFKQFEETTFYKFWQDRIKNETNYINNCKTATIGDMNSLRKRQRQIDFMLNTIRTRSDNLDGDSPINLDVEGFIFENMNSNGGGNGNHLDNDDDYEESNLRDLEEFENLSVSV